MDGSEIARMQVHRDYYEILGVSRDADGEEIRKSFRRLAFQYHPDRNHDADAEDKFKEINEAYQCLCDPEKRQMYDLRGPAGSQGGYGDAGFGGLGEIFDTFFGGAFSDAASRTPRQGESFRFKAKLTFEEAAFGCAREFTVRRTEACQDCNGTGCAKGTSPLKCPDCRGSGRVRKVEQSIFGRFSHTVRCSRCDGAGSIITSPCLSCKGAAHIAATRTLRMQIPAGIDNGGQVTLRGQGSLGAHGGPAGDVHVTVEVQAHELFTRNGLDIGYELPVNFAQAALGGEVTVPVLGGTTTIRVPSNTQTGRIIRLKGKGIQEIGGRRSGDEVIQVRVVTPKKLDAEQRRLFEELAKVLPVE
jgi:molecular chaperone DnaJ